MNRVILVLGLVSSLLFGGGYASAEELPEWIQRTRISGLMFGDAYWVARNHDDAIEGENGFWFRRIYLTFDSKVNDQWALRLRFEANSPGDFSSDEIDPFVKDAYLKGNIGGQTLYLGLSSSPTWSLVEKSWGYRAVEKTPLDLQKLGSSRDFGVALKGSFGGNGKFRYHGMLGNGSGTKGETSEGKKAMLAISFHPTKKYQVEVYGDFENRPGETNRRTVQFFGSYAGKNHRFGVQAARQNRETAGGEDLDLDLASVYAVFRLREKVNLLARLDKMFDPNPDGDGISYIPFDSTADSTLALLGIDLALGEKVNLIPSIEAVSYDSDSGTPTPDDDLIARVTFFVRF